MTLNELFLLGTVCGGESRERRPVNVGDLVTGDIVATDLVATDVVATNDIVAGSLADAATGISAANAA